MAVVVLGAPGLGMLSEHRRLEVWGDPIDHSRSPQLHGAAYCALGLDWEYGRRRVGEGRFAGELATLDPRYRGLSLTMPLKTAAFGAAQRRDAPAEATRAVNTLLIEDGELRGFNTDVGGLVRDLGEHGIADAPTVRLIGAGATATSALVAVAELGAREVEIVARRSEAARPLVGLGESLGISVTARPFEGPFAPRGLTLATLPGGVHIPEATAGALAESGGTLYDVVYGHWPTTLATAWTSTGAPAVSGRGMLLHQALLQVRVFVLGDAERPFDEESRVLAAMRAALADAEGDTAVGD